jgi:site-specific DNA recombinase
MTAAASLPSARLQGRSREQSGTDFFFSAWKGVTRVAADAKLQAKSEPAPARVCGIYTRKSIDEGLEQDFNTLEAQREGGEACVSSQRHEGWIFVADRYDDGGFTGANLDRPALKRLLADVVAGKINCIVVYKIDRLTRSLLDFARIMEILDKHGATFVAVTQQFNTTTSIGRLTLNIVLSFAQFEREMTSERTRDKMHAARRKGKWIGGNLVLGYDVAPQGRFLVINEEEAARVREIFQLYLKLGSLIPVIGELDRRGWLMKRWTTREGRTRGGATFNKTTLHNLLTNVVYSGCVKFEGKIFAGEQARIVDDDVFNSVQEQLHRNGRRGGGRTANKYGGLLKGLVKCSSCGVAMIHSFVRKKQTVYRYYVCMKAHQRGWAGCETKSVSAPTLEGSVIE